MKKKIVILGSTGSIGRNTVNVVKHLTGELEVVGLAARGNIEMLAQQARELKCRHVALSDISRLDELRKILPANCKIHGGQNGILEVATLPEADFVLCAIVGTGGLVPVLEAIAAGKDIAIASKKFLSWRANLS